MSHKGFELPNHTQTPNSFFDQSLKEITSMCELKVVLAVIRKTFGWHQREERISVSQLERVTGLSRQGVQNGITLALEHGFIKREAVGQGFSYALVLVNKVDHAKVLHSPAMQQPSIEVCKDVAQQVCKDVAQPTNKETSKETLKERKTRPAKKPQDERATHPALVAIREVKGAYPTKDLWDLIIDKVGSHPDVPKLRQCWEAWRVRNYSPQNLGWLVDWYFTGIPPANGRGGMSKVDASVAAGRSWVAKKEAELEQQRNRN